jgi:hypothetical protein
MRLAMAGRIFFGVFRGAFLVYIHRFGNYDFQFGVDTVGWRGQEDRILS